VAGTYSKPFNISLFWYYIKQIMNVFLRAMVRIFSFGERWNVPFNSAVASLNGTFHLSPDENILTIALINIHYLYAVVYAVVVYKLLIRRSEFALY
jgi:glucan phosphoethanolaminetransferase (alkaline phosphatase superfamily)